MILSQPRVRGAMSRAFAEAGYALDLSRVKERMTSRVESFVYLNCIWWGTAARKMWVQAETYQGNPPHPYDIWKGICHECAHLWQAQTRGQLWFHAAIICGRLRSLPGWWDHDAIPFEREADSVAAAVYHRALQLWLEGKP